jgi:hypothetical protein
MHTERETDLVLDVGSVWEERLDLARCFGSQLHRDGEGRATRDDDFPTLISRPDFLDRIEARARVWGRRAGVELGEPLVAAQPVALSDPRALLQAPERGDA